MFEFGSFSQFDDSVSIADPSIAVGAKAIELSINKGRFYQAMPAPLTGIDTVDFEVYNRTKTARVGEVGTGGWADGTTTVGLPVDSTFIKGITVGHVLKVEDEKVHVKAVDRTANTIDVFARGAEGTTGASHVATTPIEVYGFAGSDAMLKEVEAVFESTKKYTNYMQTIFELIDWEFQGNNLRRKGLAESKIKPILIKEAMTRVAEYLAKISIHGGKQVGVAGGAGYTSAGLLSQLADNAGGGRPVLTTNVAGAFTEPALRASLEKVFKNGKPNTILLSYANKEIANAFNQSNTKVDVMTDLANRQAGYYVDQYNYDGQILNFMVDADMPNDKVAVINMSKCTKGWMVGDGLRTEVEPQKSSREFRESIQGSLGFAIEDVGYEHELMTGLTTT